MRRAAFALIILVGTVAQASAHSTQQCLNSPAVKSAIAAATATCSADSAATVAALMSELAAVRAELAAARSSIPCTAFAHSMADAATYAGQSATVCVVVNGIGPCGSDVCAHWSAP